MEPVWKSKGQELKGQRINGFPIAIYMHVLIFDIILVSDLMIVFTERSYQFSVGF